MRHLVLLLVLPGLGLLAPVSGPGARASEKGTPSSPESSGPVVARVGEIELTARELLIRYAHLPASVRYRYRSREDGLEAFLRDTVAEMALARDAEEAGVRDHPLFEVLERIHREEILRDLHGRETLFGEIDDELLRRRYEEQKETRFSREPRVELRQILVTPVDDPLPEPPEGDATDPEAARGKIRDLHRRLRAGADFALLAERASEGRASKSAGSLGWVAKGELLPILDRTAFLLAPGETSDPIESEQGFHLLQVTDREPGGTVPFDLVRELLLQEVVAERIDELSAAARARRDEVLEERTLEIYPERLPW